MRCKLSNEEIEKILSGPDMLAQEQKEILEELLFWRKLVEGGLGVPPGLLHSKTTTMSEDGEVPTSLISEVEGNAATLSNFFPKTQNPEDYLQDIEQMLNSPGDKKLWEIRDELDRAVLTLRLEIAIPEMISTMRAHEIIGFNFEYSGGGDNGQIDTALYVIEEATSRGLTPPPLVEVAEIVTRASADSRGVLTVVKREVELIEAAKNLLAHRALEKLYDGWENNDGGSGTISMFLEDNDAFSIVIEHNAYYTECFTDTTAMRLDAPSSENKLMNLVWLEKACDLARRHRSLSIIEADKKAAERQTRLKELERGKADAPD